LAVIQLVRYGHPAGMSGSPLLARDSTAGAPAGTTAALADWAISAYRGVLPENVLARSALTLTDTVACALAGSGLAGGSVVAREIERLGGPPEATSLHSGELLPAPAAAFVNAVLANVADLDDNLLYHVHIACTIVPAAMAAAESVGASGAELLAALAIGYDVAARIALSHEAAGRVVSDPPELEIAWPAAYGHGGNTLGAATAAACLLGLDAAQLRHALGIAAYSAPLPSIARAVQLPRPPLQRYAAYGSMAWSGMMAARLAGAGLTADADVLDGPSGLWRMSGSERISPGFLSADSEQWWILESSYKREPACSWARPALRALRELLHSHPVGPPQIDRILVRTHLLSSAPMFLATKVGDYAGAQMSFPFAIAAVAAGLPEELWYDEEAIAGTSVRRLMPRVQIDPSEESTRAVWLQLRDGAWPRRVRGIPTEVQLFTAAGTWSARAEYGDGDPAPGCTFGPAEIAHKFARHARRRLGDQAHEIGRELLAAAQHPSAPALLEQIRRAADSRPDNGGA
jgi:2-methylcitrate dehydratase PrpD